MSWAPSHQADLPCSLRFAVRPTPLPLHTTNPLLHPLTSSYLCQHSSRSSPHCPQLLSRTFSQAGKHRAAVGESQDHGYFSARILNPKPCSSHIHLQSAEKTASVRAREVRTDRQIPACSCRCPQLDTWALFLPQPPKAPLNIWLPECNPVAMWPQSSNSEISMGLCEVFTFACANWALGNIATRGRIGLTGTGKLFSTRIKSPGWCPSGNCSVLTELHSQTEHQTWGKHQEYTGYPETSETLGKKSCEQQQSVHSTECSLWVLLSQLFPGAILRLWNWTSSI